MQRIILYIGEKNIIGSDGLMKIDGRFKMESIKNEVKKRNERYIKKFPHLVADGFRFCNERLTERGQIIKL